MFDPKARTMLQNQVSIIQNKMMDRALLVFAKYEDYNDVEKLKYFDMLMNLYNKYTEVLVHDILIPLDDPSENIRATSSSFANLIRRLNRGYANFVYDTTSSRLQQLIEEEEHRKNLNDKENPEQNPTITDNENEEGGNDDDL